MKNILDKFLNWLLLSSQDANQWSLTIKGATVAIPTILVFANLAHLQVTSDSLTAVIDAVSNVVLYIGGGISACVTAYGLIRKLASTILGSNKTAGVQ